MKTQMRNQAGAQLVQTGSQVKRCGDPPVLSLNSVYPPNLEQGWPQHRGGLSPQTTASSWEGRRTVEQELDKAWQLFCP